MGSMHCSYRLVWAGLPYIMPRIAMLEGQLRRAEALEEIERRRQAKARQP